MNNRYAYPEFEANQVLSFQHLNQLADYLEGQDRLTRRALIGAGVVRGLHVSWRDGAGLVLSPGIALTSDGYLAFFEEEIVHDARRAYTPPGGYEPFPEGTTLWEMLPAGVEAEPPGEPITPATIEGHTALLFLEMTSADLDRCIGDHCINQGRENRLVSWRLLLVPSASAITIRLRTLGLPTTGLVIRPPERTLTPVRPTLALPPTLSRQPALTSATLARPALTLVPAFTPTTRLLNDLYPAWQMPVLPWEKFLLTPRLVISHEVMAQRAQQIFDAVRTSFASGLSRAVALLAPALGREADVTDATSSFQTTLATAVSQLQARRYVGWQHLWDHLRHLYTAYAELRESAFAWFSRLPPPKESFPQHVFLGLFPPADTLAARAHRTAFVPSPALTLGGRDEDLCLQRFERLLALVRAFALPERADLRVTPGASWDCPLADRAIPFYYEPGASLPVWSRRAQERFRTANQFSYHRDHLSADTATQDPLRFEFDGADFFRIEGHQGRDRNDVEQFIEAQRQAYDLPFRVVTVRYGSPQGESALSPSDLEDLTALYAVSAAEMKCHLNRLLSLLSNLSRPRLRLTDLVALDAANRMRIDYTRFTLFPEVEEEEVPAASPGTAGSSALGRLSMFMTRIDPAVTATLAGTSASPTATSASLSQVPGRMFDFQFIPVPAIVLPQIDPKARVNFLVQELLGRLTQAGEQLPEQIAEFQPEELENNLAEARNRARALQLALGDLMKTDNYVVRGFENDLLEELGAFQGNCVPTRLVQIAAEWARRFERIKALPTLGSFIAQHPGIDHRSGVAAGGTLILVVGRPAATPTRPTPGSVRPPPVFPLRPEILTAAASTPVATVSPAAANLSHLAATSRIAAPSSVLLGSLLTNRETAEAGDADDTVARLIQTNLDREPATVLNLSSHLVNLLNDLVLRPQAQEDVVLADFQLPYVCCAERTHVSYLVMPELQLSLPREVFTKDDQATYPFTALPPGGSLDGPGVVTQADGSFGFAPAAEAVAVGPVRFTYSVSGRQVALTIRVEEAPPAPDPEPEQLTAAFDFTITERTPRGALVQFRPSIEGSPERFLWDFGNGQGSTEETPDPVFYSPGRFVAVLTVFRGSETAEAKRPVVIDDENPAPVPLTAGFTFRVGQRTDNGIPVTFRHTASGSPESFAWDFGNGQTSTEEEPAAILYQPGLFVVTLKVARGSESASANQTLALDRPLTADFTFEIGGRTDRGTPVTFRNTSIGNPEKFNWTFGNGETTDVRDPETVLYREPGTFEVSLEIFRGEETATATRRVQIPRETTPTTRPDLDRLLALRSDARFASGAGGASTVLAGNLGAPAELLERTLAQPDGLAAATNADGEVRFGKSLGTALRAVVSRLTEPPARMTAEEANHLFQYGAELAAVALATFLTRDTDVAGDSPVVTAVHDFAKAVPSLRRRALTREIAAEPATIESLKAAATDRDRPRLAGAAKTLVEALNP